MTVDELRQKNQEILDRFIHAGSASEERRAIWAEDAVFELPLQGKVFRGREAILQRGRDMNREFRRFELTDLTFLPLLDPNMFLVTHGSEEEDVNGVVRKDRFAHIFTLKDGRVVRRVEFHSRKD